MIRNFRNKRRNSKARSSRNNSAQNKSNGLASFEQLEDRNMLAFSAFLDGVTSTLTLTQFANDGAVTIDNNGGGGQFRAIDGSGTATFFATNNLVVNMLDFSGNLAVDLDSALAGDLTLGLGNGSRLVEFTGSNNTILGSVNITGNVGQQVIEVARTTSFTVGVDFNVNLGSALDTVDEDNRDINIGNNLNFVGVNQFEVGGTTVIGGNMSSDTTAETIGSDFDNDGDLTVTGNFNYLGGNGEDFIQLNSAVSIGGNVVANLGDSIGGGGSGQTFRMNSAGNSVGGTMTVTAGDNLDGFSDDFLLNTTGTFGGDIVVNYGAGPNDIQFIGLFGGTSVSYTGGSGVDTVLYDMAGNPANVNIVLGDGDDVFTLGPNASISPTTLTVDFGDNNDTYVNNFGAFTFNASLLGLQGFDYVYDFGTDSLIASEISGVGTVEFDNNGPGLTFRYNNVLNLPGATHLTVNMLNGSGNTLDIDIDTALAGDLVVNLGDGTRSLNFVSGASNVFNGNVSVTGGADAQTVEIAVNAPFVVGGNASFDLGLGDDTVDEDGNNVSIAGNLDLVGVNEFENNGTMAVGGNVTVDNSGEAETSRFDNDVSLSIGGNFSYTGGDGRDEVLLNDTLATVGGDVFIDLGDNTAGGTQYAWLNSAATTVGGSVTVLSTNSATSDDYQDNVGATIGGDILVNLGGGTNNADFLGTFGGTKVRYVGLDGADTVTYGMTGALAFVNAKLGAGDDSFTLEAGASISPTTLRVDFGGGNDTFTNNFGAFTFNAVLLNWHGYTRYYTLVDDMWNIHQVLDTGDVTLDNNGAGGAIRLTSSGVSEMTPATNVRLNLLNNTTTNVVVDLDSALAGNLLLQLRHGARDVTFTGTSNNVGGYVIMLGGDGVNTFDLAVNADLVTGSDLIINGRDGSDWVDDGANNITVGGNFILRGINTFEITNTLTVGGNFNMVTMLENEKSILDNDGTMNITGGLNYLGGSGADDVLLNTGGVNIGLALYVNLGESTDLVNAQHVSLFGGVVADYVSVKGATANAGNEFLTNATTNISGDVIVDFSGSANANTGLFFGTYGGTYGTFRGGAEGDIVNFGASAIDMAFVSLMNGGDDIFSLEATASLLSLHVNFGDGADTFVDNLGMPYPFPVTILNLP